MTNTTKNVKTRTGTVHAARTLTDGTVVPACMGGSQISRFSGTGIHLAIETTDDVTCSRCAGTARTTRLTAEEKAERKAAEKARRQVVDAEAAAARREGIARRIEWLAGREAEMVAAGGDPMLEALRADLAALRAQLAG